ncbi:MAG: hypothetical protein V3T30_06145 [Thermodesulfobacteriota bacterium]
MGRLSVLFMTFVVAAFFSVATVGSAEAAPKNGEDTVCSGLNGAAKGLCTAALANGCDDPDTRGKSCGRLESNYTKITGDEPVWLAVTCPCGDADSFSATLSALPTLSCVDLAGSFISVSSPRASNAVFAHYAGVTGQGCGSNGRVTSYTTDKEAGACVEEIQEAASTLSLTCSSGVVTGGRGR